MDNIIIGLLIVILIWQIGIFFLVLKVRKAKDNEYYTDYIHKNLILRVFKPEFEYQAVGNIERGKLLDRGTFSPYYFWALIER